MRTLRRHTHGYNANDWGNKVPRTCVLRFDNQAAAAALVKGRTSSELGAALVNISRDVDERGETRWRIQYADAISNIAGQPPRLCAMPNSTGCAKTEGSAPIGVYMAFESLGGVRREATHLGKRN